MLLAACGDATERTTAPSVQPLLRSLDATSAATSGAITSVLAPKLCADVSGGSRTAGARVITWTCAGTANQQFTLASTGEIQAYGGALCLDASGGAGRDGDAVIVWTCNGQPNQRWTAMTDGRLVGINGKCLDIPGASTNQGSALIIWACHGGANQRWTTVAASAPPVAPEPVPPAPPPAAPPTGSEGIQPTLPQTSVDVVMPPQTGRTINVPAGGDLQAALDAAQSGDVVTLAPGATYRGNYTLRQKSGSGWIVVRTGVPDASLPAAGTRMTPARAASAGVARILTARNGLAAISVATAAARWRIVGVEIGVDPSVTSLYSIVAFDAGQTSLAQVPRDLVLDRVWIHGTPTLGIQRCLLLNSASTAVVDSYLSDCHGRGYDSQAIVGWNGPGPFLIQNNHLEGAGENVMFGGADPSIAGLVPSDITIRGNHFHKPLSWKGVWTVKNSLELKMGRRVLVERNVFDGSWEDAQGGYAWVLTAAQGPVADVWLRHNVVRNVGAGVQFSAGAAPVVLERVRLEQNLFERVNAPGSGYGGAGRMLLLTGGGQGAIDVSLVNNTFGSTGSQSATGDGISHFMILTGPTITRLTIANNLAVAGTFGLRGDGTGSGQSALDRYAPGAVLRNNLFVGLGSWLPSYPAGTLTTNSPEVTWSSPAAGNWQPLGTVPATVGASIAPLRTMQGSVTGG